jgi:hypothetical protein
MRSILTIRLDCVLLYLPQFEGDSKGITGAPKGVNIAAVKESHNPNPAGKAGKPISLGPIKFDDAIRKILSAPPPPKGSKPDRKQRKKSDKK